MKEEMFLNGTMDRIVDVGFYVSPENQMKYNVTTCIMIIDNFFDQNGHSFISINNNGFILWNDIRNKLAATQLYDTSTTNYKPICTNGFYDTFELDKAISCMDYTVVPVLFNDDQETQNKWFELKNQLTEWIKYYNAFK